MSSKRPAKPKRPPEVGPDVWSRLTPQQRTRAVREVDKLRDIRRAREERERRESYYRQRGAAPQEIARRHPAYMEAHRRPNPEMNSSTRRGRS